MGNSDDPAVRISLSDGEVSIQLSKSRSVFFRAPELRNLSYSQFDFALLAAFISSIATGQKSYIDFPVTGTALRQFDNYSRAVRALSPEQFEKPQVICSNIIWPEAGGNNSKRKIVTLSGGVDSTYAALSAKFRDQTYTHCLLIKGFDYPLDNVTGFDELKLRVGRIADEIGLQLIVIETNLREEMSHFGLQHTGALACCLNVMAGAGFGGGGYAADFTAIGDVLRAPWGNCLGIASTLTTDHFPIDYLGGEVGRTGKIKWLSEQNPGLFRYLSVCRKDKSTGGNCGKCEKCARTRLGLMAIPDARIRTEAETALFGGVSNYLDFFKLNTKHLKSMPRLLDLSATLPESEARKLVNDEIDRIILTQKRIDRTEKRNRKFRKFRRIVAGGLNKIIGTRGD